MAFANIDSKVDGEFTLIETKLDFHYGPNDGQFPAAWDMPHVVYVGFDQIRAARVLKTVAYIVVDEADDGTPVTEKWQVRENWSK